MNAVADAEPMARTAQPTPLVRFTPDEAQIARWREEFADLPARVDTPEGYAACKSAYLLLRKAWNTIEKARLAANTEAQASIKAMNAEAQRYKSQIDAIGEPLKEARQRVDDEKARVAREAEEAERARLAAIEQARKDKEEADRLAAWQLKEQELEAKRLVEESRQRVENERLAAEAERQRVERERFEAEQRQVREEADKRQREQQAALDAQRRADEAERIKERRRLDAEAAAVRETQRKQQEAIDRKAREVQAEKDRLAAEQAARDAAAKAEKETRERVERERQADLQRQADAEAAAFEAARLAEEERQRVEALKPDVQKIADFGRMIRLLEPPQLATDEAAGFMLDLMERLADLAGRCETFGLAPRPLSIEDI